MRTLPTTKTWNHTFMYQLNVHKMCMSLQQYLAPYHSEWNPRIYSIWLPPSICSLKTTKFWVINIYVIYIIIEKTSWHDPPKRLILVCLTIRTFKIPIVDHSFSPLIFTIVSESNPHCCINLYIYIYSINLLNLRLAAFQIRVLYPCLTVNTTLSQWLNPC